MSIPGYIRHQPQSFACQLAANIRDALHVAGAPDASGNPRPLRSVTLQQRTGIARSTLRALKNCGEPAGPNPDLHTLSRLAEGLGIPLAFLVMRPEDWRTLAQAINNLPEMTAAAEAEIGNGSLQVPAGTPERVLRALRVQPEPVPYSLGLGAEEVVTVERRNERRRRASHVLGTLMLRGAPDRDTKVLQTALAASLAHQLSYSLAESGQPQF